jgi:hypothetical protein
VVATEEKTLNWSYVSIGGEDALGLKTHSCSGAGSNQAFIHCQHAQSFCALNCIIMSQCHCECPLVHAVLVSMVMSALDVLDAQRNGGNGLLPADSDREYSC